MTGIVFVSIMLLSLLLLVFENLAASFFWTFFYRKWPERLVLEEELDREFQTNIQKLETPKGDLRGDGLLVEYKITQNGDGMTAPFIFLKLAGSRVFAKATIHSEGNVPKSPNSSCPSSSPSCSYSPSFPSSAPLSSSSCAPPASWPPYPNHAGSRKS